MRLLSFNMSEEEGYGEYQSYCLREDRDIENRIMLKSLLGNLPINVRV